MENNSTIVSLDYLTAGCNNETGTFDGLNGYIMYASGKNVLISQIPACVDDTVENRRVMCALPNAPRGRVHSCQWINCKGFLGALVGSDDGFLRYYQYSGDNLLSFKSWSLKSELNLESSVTLASWSSVPESESSDSNVFVVAATVKGEIFFINNLFDNATAQLVKSFAPKKITALTVGILPATTAVTNTTATTSATNNTSPFILAALSDSNIRVIIKDSSSADSS